MITSRFVISTGVSSRTSAVMSTAAMTGPAVSTAYSNGRRGPGRGSPASARMGRALGEPPFRRGDRRPVRRAHGVPHGGGADVAAGELPGAGHLPDLAVGLGQD